MYVDAQTSESYSYKDKLIGLPVFINYSVMYNNMEILNKYNKRIPKTWNELLITGKYIYEKEKEINPDILIYNGAFIDDEIGMGSLYEFIYSFRDSVEAPFPDLLSENTENALKMMKTLKNEISSDSIYKTLDYSISKLGDGNGVFIKFNYINMPIYQGFKASVLPGNIEGVSGSIIGGYNIGISKYALRENRESAVEAVLYMTSREIQKEMMINFKKFSGIASLFDDDENCEDGELCDIHKKIQPVARPTTVMYDYNAYSEKFRNYVYNYLYGDDNVKPMDMLRKIDEISQFYYISVTSNHKDIGKILASVYLIIIILILSSSYFPFHNDLQYFFSFLSRGFWIISLIGYVLMVVVSYLDMEKVTVVGCSIKQLLQFLGFTFIFIPIFHKLLSNYPEENSYTEWIKKHPYSFLMIFIAIDLALNSLNFFSPYIIENVVVPDGKNFQKCRTKQDLSKFILILSTMIKSVVLVESLILIYMEINYKNTYYDVRFCISAFIIDFILIIIIMIIDFINIQNFALYVVTRQMIFLTYIFSNYFFLYFIRVIVTRINKDFHSKKEIELIKKTLKLSSTNTNSSISYSYFSKRFDSDFYNNNDSNKIEILR